MTTTEDFIKNSLGPEWAAEFDGAVKEQDQVQDTEAEMGDFTLRGVTDETPLPVDGRLSEDEFWNSRDYLQYVRDYAYAKTEAPYALLLATICRVSAEVGPHIVLPDVVGSHVSLNYYGVLVDNSGGGKTSVLNMSRSFSPWETEECGVTSGEGLITSYTRRAKQEDGSYATEMKTDRLLVLVDESEALLAIDSRHGNTTMSHLRTLWSSGGSIGLNNKAEVEKQRLAAHSVRTAVIVGGQPVALGRVLTDEGRGTAERFVTMRLSDPTIPSVQPPRPQGALPLRLDHLPHPQSGVLRSVEYDPRIRQFIVETHWAEKTGTAQTSSVISPSKFGKVTGHRVLLIAKTAALLASWDGRTMVTFEDWALAVHFLTVSGEARAWAMERLEAARDADNRAVGVATAHREMAAEEVKSRTALGKTVDRALGVVSASAKEMSASQIRKKVAHTQRPFLDQALESAVALGKLVAVERPDQSGRGGGAVTWYSLGPNS